MLIYKAAEATSRLPSGSSYPPGRRRVSVRGLPSTCCPALQHHGASMLPPMGIWRQDPAARILLSYSRSKWMNGLKMRTSVRHLGAQPYVNKSGTTSQQ